MKCRTMQHFIRVYTVKVKKTYLTKKKKKKDLTPKNIVSNQKEESISLQRVMYLYETRRQMTFHLLTGVLDGPLYTFEGSEVAILKLKSEDWFLLDK